MKTAKKGLLVLVLAAMCVSVHGVERPDAGAPGGRATDNDTYINPANILMFVTNTGGYGRDIDGVFGHGAGTFFPYTSIAELQSGLLDDYVLFAGGLWLGGKVNDDIRLALSEFGDEFVPGHMANGTFLPDDPAFRVYKLYSDSLGDNPNQDWLDWPVSQGAPVDEFGNPEMMGVQMTWSVFNDADPSAHNINEGFTDPLGVEVKHTTFAFDATGALGNTIFHRWVISNKGGNQIDSFFISLWNDPDLGDHTDDLVGCDTILNIGYCYNADNDDANHYEDRPPCVGFNLLQGPLHYTGNPVDTGLMWGEAYSGYVNLETNVFTESFNYMRGLSADGDPYTYNGQHLSYFHSGDPVTGTGDLDFAPADRRMMMTSGPISFAPGDSTELIVAMVIGQGPNHLASVSVMKAHAVYAHMAYEAGFGDDPGPGECEEPFHVEYDYDSDVMELCWDDAQGISLPSAHQFEGYKIQQGPSPVGPWTEIANFDLANGLVELYDSVFNPQTGLFEWTLIWEGQDNGLAYELSLPNDPLTGLPYERNQSYFFRLSAIRICPWCPSGDKIISMTTVREVDLISGQVIHVPDDYSTISEAIQNAVYTDTIVIACGTYYEHDLNAKIGVPIRSETGEPDCVTIDAQGLGRVFVESLTLHLIGLTLRGGVAMGEGEDGMGGAIINMRAYNLDATRLVSCAFIDNHARIGGALAGASINLFECSFTGNSALEKGGGVHSSRARNTIVGTLFANNSSDSGGAVFCQQGNFEACTFVDNQAQTGAAICIASANGGYRVDSSSFCFNGPGIVFKQPWGYQTYFTCSNMYGNTTGDWSGNISDFYSTDGNISVDPRFCDPESGDYTLRAYSPLLPGNNDCGELIGATDLGCQDFLSQSSMTVLSAFEANEVNPAPLLIHIGEISDGTPVADVTDVTVTIDGNAMTFGSAIIPDGPYAGESLELSLIKTDIIDLFTPLWGSVETSVELSFSTPTDDFTAGLPLTIHGHIPGDVDLSGEVDIADIVYLSGYMFTGGPAPRLPEVADIDCSGQVDIGDIVKLVQFMFNGGAEPTLCP